MMTERVEFDSCPDTVQVISGTVLQISLD